MKEKTVLELIDALEEIKEEYGNLPVSLRSVTADWGILAIVVGPEGQQAIIQIVRTS